MRILKLGTVGLALAALGCGSSTGSQTGFASNSNQIANNLGGTPRTLQINVPPGGGSVALPRTETVSGTLTFACLIPGHFEAGMRGDVTVVAN